MKLLGPPERDLSFWGVTRGIAVAIVVALLLTGLAYLLAQYIGQFFLP